MGGGRLTAEERRGIEAGLAEGLPYAAIARRLGRPTSTVSREVGRNCGPGGYRAEHADRAEAWRRRNRPTPPPTPPRPPRPPQPQPQPSAPPSPTGTPAPDAVHAYVERFAAKMIGTGLPRTAARVLACLVTTPSGTQTAAELAQRLGTSPASVSKAVGYLEELDVLRRERDHESGRRRERYVVDDGVWLRTWLAGAERNVMWAETAQEGVELFGSGTPTGARLDAMRRFFAQVYRDMTGLSATACLDDILTVLVALLHAGRPLTTAELATALGWTEARTATAVTAADENRLGRLTSAQRATLRR
ncbi:helix-turn-helix domain-containing protein [Streptomyces sp. NPDC029674]|uniref:GbsR/MarR family transcriptional regulator n=1 Tax=Streptomyces sp. NPDC029674 TaxID=3365297 RepID=UPI0038501447